MKRCPISIPVLCLLALVAAGCAHKSAQPASEAGTPDQKFLTEVIEFPRQTLILKPTRDDITVGRVVFSVYCPSPEDVRVNGVQLDPAWRDIHLTQTGIVVDRRSSVVPDAGAAWMLIHLKRTARNQFEFAPLKIEFSNKEHSSLLCMSVKAWFNEVTNQYDAMYYQNLDDRYALVSYCTRPPDNPSEAGAVRARFSQNRVATVNEFKQVLSRPFVIRLNQEPLREEWSR